MANKLFKIHVQGGKLLTTSYLTSEETNIGYIFPVGILEDCSFDEYKVVEISGDKTELWVEIIRCIPDF